MALFTFRLPDVGEGVAEAEIVAWHVKVGDRMEEDQSLVDIMTDKATVEVTTPVSGVVLKLHGEVGQMVPVGSLLVELETDQEGAASSPSQPAPPVASPPPTAPAPVASAPKSEVPKPAAVKPKSDAALPPAFTTRAPGMAPLAAPATRRRAFELGIPLQFVPGTGPGGRITSEDLDTYIASGGQNSAGAPAGGGFVKRTSVNDIKIVGLRRKIAERMQEATRRIPHFAYVEEFDLTELEALRQELNAGRKQDQPKLTLLPFFMRALVKALPAFPQVNSNFDDDAGVLHCYEGVHIGIATQTSGGLMVPVVRHAEARDLWDCARELARVTTAARDGSATRDELTGSTITLTSLGAIGGIAATPVINRPEVAIIGPNKLEDRPVVLNGQVVIRTMMNVSSSFDHRIVDGYDAAQFIQSLKRLIERPALLFVEGT